MQLKNMFTKCIITFLHNVFKLKRKRKRKKINSQQTKTKMKGKMMMTIIITSEKSSLFYFSWFLFLLLIHLLLLIISLHFSFQYFFFCMIIAIFICIIHSHISTTNLVYTIHWIIIVVLHNIFYSIRCSQRFCSYSFSVRAQKCNFEWNANDEKLYNKSYNSYWIQCGISNTICTCCIGYMRVCVCVKYIWINRLCTPASAAILLKKCWPLHWTYQFDSQRYI